MGGTKKCQPLKCKYFSRLAKQLEHKIPVDVLVVKCPYRSSDNFCGNVKESLKEVYYEAPPKLEIKQ